MTSSITTDEQEGTGAQERHWQPVPCLYLYRLWSGHSDYPSNPTGPRTSLGPHSLGVMKSGPAALLSTTEPGVGPGGVNSRCSFLLP